MSINTIQLPRENPLLTITHPSSFEWIIELHNGEDSRLTEHFIENAILPALGHVEHEWLKTPTLEKSKYAKGCLIIIGKRSQDKLLSYPIPTIAALNGHVFAAGFILALACDYRVIRSDKDRRIWGCMNEQDLNKVHFGAPLPPSFSALLSKKVLDQCVLRKITLEGHRFTPSELLQSKLVDEIVDGDINALLQSASKFAEKWSQNATNGVWGLIKNFEIGTSWGGAEHRVRGFRLNPGTAGRLGFKNPTPLVTIVTSMEQNNNMAQAIAAPKF
ncbi:hypothetical protein Clacol_002509 [Clathrus columnatus]|uniref:Enoyl-CoA hydratase/isomerase family protein n=1 Tax=Clathrus columnatus TaxID=1419009 RepID=A0AAV5A4B2_9AGAM|nr:hypothetical protein Clacol_002509 [Clathrus columnatus]